MSGVVCVCPGGPEFTCGHGHDGVIKIVSNIDKIFFRLGALNDEHESCKSADDQVCKTVVWMCVRLSRCENNKCINEKTADDERYWLQLG